VETVARALGRRPRALADVPPLADAPAAPGGVGRAADAVSPALLERAVTLELARTLEDVLLRRTGLASAGHPGRPLVEATARALQPRLDWSDRERVEQIERFDASFHFAGNVADAPAGADA